jgi:DNA repair ATPase RecN
VRDKLFEIKHRVDKLKWTQESILNKLQSIDNEIAKIEEQLKICKEASIIVSRAVEDTQKSLQTSVTDVVNKALATVFDEPYEVSIDWYTRGKDTKSTQARFVLKKKGVEADRNLLQSIEGGQLSIISVILRIAFLSLRNDTRKVLLLDEVLAAVSKTKGSDGVSNIERAEKMLRTIADKFGVQIILVSHAL